MHSNIIIYTISTKYCQINLFKIKQKLRNKKCNIGYVIYHFRNDQTTMMEHLFTHFPDICGFACIVCRKTEKRKKNLMAHLETAHSQDILEMLGVSNLALYEEHFSSNSDEQINLRFVNLRRMGGETDMIAGQRSTARCNVMTATKYSSPLRG